MSVRHNEKTIALPLLIAEPDNVKKLIEFVYNNQATGIQKEGPDGNAMLLLAWLVSQGLMKTVVTLLEQSKSFEDFRKVTEGLKSWCQYE